MSTRLLRTVANPRRMLDAPLPIVLLPLAILIAVWVTGGGAGRSTRAFTVVAAGLSSLGAPTGATTLYVDTGSNVAAIDALTGRVLREIPVRRATQSILLALSPAGDRFFVTDAAWEQSRQVNYLNIYRARDWTIERQVPVPDLIRYPGNPPEGGLLSSADGRLLHVSMARGATDATSKYWVATLDVAAGTWLPGSPDLPGCGGSRLLRGPLDRPLVLCLGSGDLRLLDGTGQRVERVIGAMPKQRRAGPSLTRVAAATVRGGRVYAVTENREVQVLDLVGPGAPRALTAAATAEKTIPGEAVAVDASEQWIFVPSGTPDERSRGLASEIAVLRAGTGALDRSIRVSGPFRGITFASDTSAAFVERVGADGVGEALVRVNLATGDEAVLIQRRPLFPGLIVGR